MRRALFLIIALHLLTTAGDLSAGAPAPPPERVQGWVWDRLGAADRASVLVILADKTDLAAATAGIDDRLARRRAVVAALRTTAARGQASLSAELDRRKLAYRSFYITNAILIEAADRTLVRELAARADVARIVGNPSVRLDLLQPTPVGAAPTTNAVAAITWGVDRIKSPVLWGLGFDGTGIVIGGQDTGIRWTHEAVKGHYRGWDGTTAAHDYNWHDSIHTPAGANPCGGDSPEPCDDHGHGTHTIGTASGGTATEVVGVAPGARWIGCRNMDEGNGTPATYLECFEYFLAPYPIGGLPTDGDPAMAPDVTVNSWSCPPAEGCVWDVLEAAVDAQRAAGIFTVAAAQNSGSGCGTVSSPPGIYAGLFTIGASDSGDWLAGFSSRGPAADTGLMKPQVVAPGVDVRSGLKGADDEYASWAGTSMATPHVAGAVALLWSAEPSLRGRIAETEALLERTATPLRWVVEGCGGDYAFGPNNSWGYGLIDVERALAAYRLPTTETTCDDLVDDDGDGFIDCADDDCAGAANCPEPGNCGDYVDNDLDGKTDCADPDCMRDPLCPESGNCTDGVDNDDDRALDCADTDCYTDPACPGLAMGAEMVLRPGGTTPTRAEVFAGACRFPAWRLCPVVIQPGLAPGSIAGEAAPFAAPALRLYEHSVGGPLYFVRSGADVAFSP